MEDKMQAAGEGIEHSPFLAWLTGVVGGCGSWGSQIDFGTDAGIRQCASGSQTGLGQSIDGRTGQRPFDCSKLLGKWVRPASRGRRWLPNFSLSDDDRTWPPGMAT